MLRFGAAPNVARETPGATYREVSVGLIELLVVLAVVGLAVWAITTYIPMDPGMKRVIHIVAIVAVVIYLLKVFGIFGHDIPIGSH